MAEKKSKGWGLKKGAKKIVKSGVKAVTNRYAPKSGFQFATAVKDLMLMKEMLFNVEKKRWDYQPGSAGALGQVNGNVSGHLCEDITPTLTQGVGEAYRIGNSVKLYSAYGKLQCRNGASQTAPVRIKCQIVRVKGDPYTNMGTFMSDYLAPNNFVNAYSMVSIYDYYSSRNIQNMNKFQVIYSKVMKISPDSVTGQAQQGELTVKLRFKNLHLKWEGDALTTPNNGQLILVMLADRGNYSGSTVSTLGGISDTAISTGYLVDRYLQYYIIDN